MQQRSARKQVGVASRSADSVLFLTQRRTRAGRQALASFGCHDIITSLHTSFHKVWCSDVVKSRRKHQFLGCYGMPCPTAGCPSCALALSARA